ncbi:uncharacterized protein [Procambarus clarkii]|uniref:uncharacterized protein n=1 Tax=Procambarus clarkii TaxID=6728 RepID=UPI001E67241E|nr:uncharacterized protein LOC123754032 [Procambarus clarkii]
MSPARLSLVFLILCLGTRTEANRRKTGEPRKKQENCEPSFLQQCMDQLQAINKDHNLAFASTEGELNKMCSTMESGLDCVHSHVTRCFDESRQRVIYQLLTGTEDVIKSLCMAGSFRDQYLVHAACMRNLSTDNLVCGLQYKRLISSVNPPEKINFEDSIRQQCCAFHNYLLCVTSAAERECGTQAAHFIEEYSYRTAGPIIQTRCKVYVPGSLECSHSTAALSSGASFWGLTLLLAATLTLLQVV